MSYAGHRAVRAAIAATLNTVADIGQVLIYTAFADREPAMRAAYVARLADGTEQLRGWRIRRTGWTERSDGVLIERRTRWRIEGFVALGDGGASELVFDDLLDAISDAFAADVTLGDTVQGCDLEDAAGIQAEDLGPVMFAGVLCHEARLSLETLETKRADRTARP